MHTAAIHLLLVKYLHLTNTPLLSRVDLEASRLDMLARCSNLLAELRQYITADPHLLLLATRLEALEQRDDLSAAELRQNIAAELKLALALF